MFGVAGTRAGATRNPGFDAGHWSTRDPDFPTSNLGPNLVSERGRRDVVVARSRYLRDNHELVDGVVETLVSKVLGHTGVGLNPATGHKELDDQLRRIRDSAFEAVDPERCCDIVASQTECYTEFLVGGESLVYFPMAEAFGEYGPGPAIELLPTEQIDDGCTGIVPAGEPGEGNAVRQGVEYDRRGRRTAFWVLVEHPHDASPFGPFGFGSVSFGSLGGRSPTSKDAAIRRLPAADARLCYRRRRSGQLRGTPRIMSAMRTIRSEDGYVDNVLLLAQLIASLGVFFTVDEPKLFQKVTKAGQVERILACDASGNPILQMRGAQMIFTPKGCEPKVVKMDGVVSPQFEQMIRSMQRRVSRGAGLGYAQVSGDNGQDNFASRRGDELDNRPRHQADQMLIFLNHTQPHYVRCVRTALLTGRLSLDAGMRQHLEKAGGLRLLYRATPMFKGQPYVNPAQEAAANEADVRYGGKSKYEIIRERGRDPLDVIREEAEYDVEDRRIRELLGAPPRQRSTSSGMSGNLIGDKAEPEDGRKGKPGQDEGDGGDDGPEEVMGYRRGDVRVTADGLDLLNTVLTIEALSGGTR